MQIVFRNITHRHSFVKGYAKGTGLIYSISPVITKRLTQALNSQPLCLFHVFGQLPFIVSPDIQKLVAYYILVAGRGLPDPRDF